MSDTLFVVLHGTICLVEHADTYRGIFIGMDEHRVCAGNFLTERTIAKHDFLKLDLGAPIEGKPAGKDKLDRTKNIVADTKHLDEIALHLFRFAEIELPKPDRLHSLRTGSLPAERVAGSFPDGADTASVSNIQVFEYKVRDVTQITLTGDKFKTLKGTVPAVPAGSPAPVNRFYSLHIFNEPETDPPDRHLTEEFNRGCRIAGIPLRLTVPLNVPPLESLPDGLREEETMSLEIRVQPVVDLLARIPRPPGQFVAIGDRHFCGTIAISLVA